jgi:hypothetical protein
MCVFGWIIALQRRPVPTSSDRVVVSRPVFAVAAVALIATFAAGCSGGSPKPKASVSATASAAVTSAAPPTSAATPSAFQSSQAAASASAPPSAAASSTMTPDAASTVSVRLTRSHQVVKGLVGTVDIDEMSVVGLPAAVAVSAALQAPVTAALADYTQGVKSQLPCTGPACGSGDFQADFTTTRADSIVVSGTWTISTFYPGGAHPTTQLTGVIVDAATGASIAPSHLFVGSSLNTLAAATLTAAKARLDAMGCNVDEEEAEVADGTAPTAGYYVGTAIGPAGLLIGLSQGQVAAEACGPLEVAVAWSDVQSQLSAIGARLAATPPPVATALIGSSAPTASSGTPPRCATTSLDVELGSAGQTASTQYQRPIVVTNVSSGPCSLLGFPGVDFGSAAAQPLSLRRAAGTPQRIVLAPGGQAHAQLTYLTGPDPACDTAGAWTPTTVTITPPDETTSVQLVWPGGSVDDCQGGATHPGSYIGPMLAG